MSNRIEVESKFFLDNIEFLEKKLKNENMSKLESIREVDEYFTDLDSEYIKNRTCLRLRKTNNTDMELTFKGKSTVLSNIYAKKESNISLNIDEDKDVVEFLYATGYYSYVKVDKIRTVYTKENEDLIYNVMIDNVRNVGYFIEFEILSNDDKSIKVLIGVLGL